MNEDQFWKIIEENKGDADRVTVALSKLTPEEIAAFHRAYYDHHNRLHRWNLWGAAYVINGGCSDDSFHYFKAWLIGKGKKVYDEAQADPDSIGPLITDEDIDNGCDNESLNYAAEMAYEKVTESAGELERSSNEFEEPTGKPWEEDDLPRLFPKLSKQFGS